MHISLYCRMLDINSGRIMWDRVGTEFEPGKVYVDGSLAVRLILGYLVGSLLSFLLQEFNKMTKLKGSNVAYFGDHLLADAREPSRVSGWRTGVIIEELEHEVRIQNSHTYRTTVRQLLTVRTKHHELLQLVNSSANSRWRIWPDVWKLSLISMRTLWN